MQSGAVWNGAVRWAGTENVCSRPRPAAPGARLIEVLERDEVWRREALGIGELAGIVGAPEHRLRKLINEGLGYRTSPFS